MKTKIRSEPLRKNPEGGNDFSPVRFMSAGIRAVEGEANERKFVLSFSSEEPYQRWYGLEILDHSDGCIDLTRLETIGVVLFNHDTDKVIGKVSRVWIEDGRGKAEIEFDDDEKSETIRKKVASGTLKGVSVGYNVSNWEEVKTGKKSLDGRFTGPCYIAKKWMPLEISVVPVPADHTVGVGRGWGAENGPGVDELTAFERTVQVNENLMKGGYLI